MPAEPLGNPGADAVEVVSRFCAAWSDGDLDALMAFFTDDAVYHNIPVDPVTGKDAIRSTIEGFTAGVDKVEFRVDHIVGAGDVVLTERVDVFSTPGRTISLPVMGTFEVRDGRIAAWRDYFDLNQFMSQLAG
jgi:limonene-1,2-epoxide hydrolase